MMDEGFVTEVTANAQTVVKLFIIMTTNPGAGCERNVIGFCRDKDDTAQQEAYTKFFAIEFRNPSTRSVCVPSVPSN